jgi:heme-degrading monooxygenase HmoA
MHGVFFDMRAKPGHMPHYFDHVARLRPILEAHPGLHFIERFRPLDDAGAILSHQLWQDEGAIAAWRAEAEHRRSQGAGRAVHFADYRIRVGAQVWHLPDPPPCDAPWAEPTRLLVALYGTAPGSEGRAYESLTRPGRFLTLADAADMPAARALVAHSHAAGAEAARVFRIGRDYGLSDRAEAPAVSR